MIDHLSSYATDFDRSQAFYDGVMKTLGAERCVDMVASWNPGWPTQRMCAYGRDGRPVFWLVEVKESFTPRHVAFSARTADEVKAFHAAGLEAGGSDNGEPGPRPIYHPGYFGCFVLDPDGNNVEAVIHDHSA